MTTFEDRERAFEAKWAHDEHFRFRVIARRDKLFARWAAGQLNLSDEAAADLTKQVLAVKDGPGHDALLLDTMNQLFATHGGQVASELAPALARFADQARAELLAHPSSEHA